MQVALPEFDGRLGAIPVAFKAEEVDAATGLAIRRLVPDPDGIAALADLAANWIALGRKPRSERRLALVMSDYPARGGRAGFAVGLDTPASVAAICDLLAEARYDIGEASAAPQDEGPSLMLALTSGPIDFAVPLAAYRGWLAGIPQTAREILIAAHGDPATDPACDGTAFRFRALTSGKLTMALQPPRDSTPDRKARYHDPDAPPSHAYLAFYLGLRDIAGIDALIHLGTHGTTEWLPGKAVALSPTCWPRLAIGR
jgi:cobaltochelatase CobN